MKLVDCDDNDDDDNDYDDDDDGCMPDEAAERRYKVVFRLYGSTQSDIDKVIGEIDELGKEAISDRILDSADNQAHIAKLTPEQVPCRTLHFRAVERLIFLIALIARLIILIARSR